MPAVEAVEVGQQIALRQFAAPVAAEVEVDHRVAVLKRAAGARPCDHGRHDELVGDAAA